MWCELTSLRSGYCWEQQRSYRIFHSLSKVNVSETISLLCSFPKWSRASQFIRKVKDSLQGQAISQLSQRGSDFLPKSFPHIDPMNFHAIKLACNSKDDHVVGPSIKNEITISRTGLF